MNKYLGDYYETTKKVKVNNISENELNFKNLTNEQKEKIAKDLANKRIDNKNILGYVAEINKSVVNVKFDKVQEIKIIYNIINNKLIILDCIYKSLREFNGEKYLEYIDELL